MKKNNFGVDKAIFIFKLLHSTIDVKRYGDNEKLRYFTKMGELHTSSIGGNVYTFIDRKSIDLSINQSILMIKRMLKARKKFEKYELLKSKL